MLSGTKVLLGISGGIAAYKTPNVVRELQQSGAEVRVVMTESAREFITPLTLQAISGAPVGTDLFDTVYEEQIGHIELARWADVVLIAPATANIIGKIANGIADDLLTTLMLATAAKLVIAPAMNTRMLENPLVRANLERARDVLGALVVTPDTGELACKEVGAGRMPAAPVLRDAVVSAVTPKKLQGRKVLITVGPTRERLDDVRFLTNASSGKMGFAMARAAQALGATVTVVAGPTTAAPPTEVRVRRVESAAEMDNAVNGELGGSVDIAVFTAAVCDTRPEQRVLGKMTKTDLPSSLPLARTTDILASTTGRDDHPFCVGFAAETGDVEARTIEKCARKGADLMIGNDVTGGAAFAADENTVIVVNGAQVIGRIGPASKDVVARDAWDYICKEYGANPK